MKTAQDTADLLRAFKFSEIQLSSYESDPLKRCAPERQQDLSILVDEWKGSLQANRIEDSKKWSQEILKEPGIELDFLAKRLIHVLPHATKSTLMLLESDGWLKRMGPTIVSDPEKNSANAKSVLKDLVVQMVKRHNKEGLATLMQYQHTTLDEVFNAVISERDVSNILYWGDIMLKEKAMPSKETLTTLSANIPIAFNYGSRLANHFCHNMLKEWAPHLTPENRSQLWIGAINNDNINLMITLMECDVTLNNWTLAGNIHLPIPNEYIHIKDLPLLDFLICREIEKLSDSESRAFKALFMIQDISNGKETVNPICFYRAKNSQLEFFNSKGINLSHQNAEGKTYLHLAYEKSSSAPNKVSTLANAKKFPEVWGIQDQKGRLPSQLVDYDWREDLQESIAQGEKRELQKALKGRRGKRVKSKVRAL